MSSQRPQPQAFSSHYGPLPPALDDNDSDEAQQISDENIDNLASDTESLIGVSIGHAQSQLKPPSSNEARLVNPATPASDKQDLALQPTVQDRISSHPAPIQDLQTPTPGNRVPSSLPHPVVSEQDFSKDDLPSPWRSTTQQMSSLDGALESFRSRSPLKTTRNRAATIGPLATDSWRKLLPSLPQLPKLSDISQKLPMPTFLGSVSGFGSTKIQGVPSEGTQGPFSGGESYTEPSWDKHRTNTMPAPNSPSMSSTGDLKRPSQTSSMHYGSKRPQPLRRTTSDGSLYLQRSLSRTSSLGDDERWTDVHEQVNSRMKAIKDSFADSNISSRFARMPDLSTIGFDSSLLDLQSLRKRARTLQGGRDRHSPSTSLEQRNGAITATPDTLTRSQTQLNAPSKADAQQHPEFRRALENLKGDVVILGGYRGSILRSAQPPYRQCWVPVKVGLNLRKVDLEVGISPGDDEKAVETIIPDGMLKNIGPVDISRRLFRRLRASKNAFDGTLRIWDFGYDWRLDPNLLSAQLLKFLQDLPCNSADTPPGDRGVTVIAHSLGGLITRHAVNERPELFSGIVYAGVPQSCPNILGPIRNGDDVLLSSKVLTAQVNFTIRTSYALLPLDGKCFFNPTTGEEYQVDFFDVKSWEDHCFSPCIARPLPPLNQEQNPTTVGTIVNSVSNVLPSLTRGRSLSLRKDPSQPTLSKSNTFAASTQTHANPKKFVEDATPNPRAQPVNPQMDHRPPSHHEPPESNPSTSVTLPPAAARAYLARTLSSVKSFKQGLAHNPSIAEKGQYPPAAVIFGKSVPTVYGARVPSREAIRHADAYDDLAFASGDGVVLARAAQLPEGYEVAKGGVVSSDRGHISLLGDLEAVGRCLNAVRRAKKIRERSEADGGPVGGKTSGAEGADKKRADEEVDTRDYA